MSAALSPDGRYLLVLNAGYNPPSISVLDVASAREISRTGRSGIYDVRVTVDDSPIAELRGHSRTVGGAWVSTAEPDARLK